MLRAKKILSLALLALGLASSPLPLRAEEKDASLQCPQLADYQEGEILAVDSGERTATFVERGFSQHYSPGHPDYRYGDYETQYKSNIYRLEIKGGNWVYKVEQKLRPSRQPAWKKGDALYWRASGDTMRLKRPEGGELRMKIVEKRVADDKPTR